MGGGHWSPTAAHVVVSHQGESQYRGSGSQVAYCPGYTTRIQEIWVLFPSFDADLLSDFGQDASSLSASVSPSTLFLVYLDYKLLYAFTVSLCICTELSMLGP